MALRGSAVLLVTGYRILDAPVGFELQFICANPGQGEPSDYTVVITDAEWAAATNANARRTVVQNKLNRKFRATGLAVTIDPIVNTTFTV